jgi:uncharacterized protein (DUF58 family)
VSAFYKNLRAFFRRRRRYQITRGGLLFAFAMLLVGIAAVASANNLLFLIEAAMVSTLLVSGLISRLSLAGLQLDFQIPEHVSVGRAVAASLYVRNLKLLMPSFSVQVTGRVDPFLSALSGLPPIITSGVYFPLIPGGAEIEEVVEVRFRRRGAHRQNSFVVSTKFPFGFLERTVQVNLQREIVVYPSIDPQPGFEELLTAVAGEMEAYYRGLGKDFYRIRPYEAFESARHVDWKATAHTGALQVREFAREQERSIEIFLDRDLPRGLEPWFEQAVNACAFLAWRLSARGMGVRFRTQEFDFRLPEEGDIYTILRFLALVQPLAGRVAGSPIDETSFQIVFTAEPRKFADLGWDPAGLLGPDVFPVLPGPVEHAGDGEDQHHRA